MKSFLNSGISFGFSLPSFRSLGFCYGNGGGVGGGGRAGGCRGIRKRSPSGLQAPGAPEKEVRDARFATVSALGFIVFVGLWFCWSWSEECRSF